MVAKQKILIVDDDENIAELISLYLTKECFETMIVYDGESALSSFDTFQPNLILLDLMLPGIDGYEICKQIRNQKNIPIIMVSAKKDDIDKIRGLGLGADDYIVKPFSPGELVARVQAHIATYNRLKGGIQEIQPEITVGAIRINPKSHRVFVKEREISLKNKEYELLLFLVTNADMVFDKETLYERIWGMDSVGDNATVAVHINRLREKIEDDPSDPHYIETVWGAGYRFRA